MGLIAKAKGGGNFELIPEDQHLARCVLVCDIGTHDGTYGQKHQCLIGWEFPEVLQVFDPDKGEEPAMLSQFYTLSLSEKANLRHMLESWRGRAFTPEELDGFDLFCLAGIGCLVQVVHVAKATGDMRAKIQTVSKLHKSMKVPQQITPTRTFCLAESTAQDFEALPEWIRDKVKESAEWPEFMRRTMGTDNQAAAAEYVEDLSGGADQPDAVPF
jgi:hypothetical protein